MSTPVVKLNDVDARSQASDAPDVRTLAERIRWILEKHPRPDGKAWNPSRLSLEAGLTRQHVATYLARAAENPDADLGRDEVAKIAIAAGVDVGWLTSGTGEPQPVTRTIETDEPSPEFAEAVRFARAPGQIFTEADIDVARRRIRRVTRRYTPKDCLDLIEAAYRERTMGIEEAHGGSAVDVEEELGPPDGRKST